MLGEWWNCFLSYHGNIDTYTYTYVKIPRAIGKKKMLFVALYFKK